MASNYPIVQLVSSSGQVYYARTFGWSSTGVATGDASESVNFTVPGNVPSGTYSLYVIANGIRNSSPYAFTATATGTFTSYAIAGDGTVFALKDHGVLHQMNPGGSFFPETTDTITSLVASTDGTVFALNNAGVFYQRNPTGNFFQETTDTITQLWAYSDGVVFIHRT